MIKHKSCNFKSEAVAQSSSTKSYFEKNRKIYRKIPTPESNFWRKLQGKDSSTSVI